MDDVIWIHPELASIVHRQQLIEHGGAGGVRDEGLLESAWARPRQLCAYGGEGLGICDLAAAYAFGIARNHPFVDGNKRTAYVVCRTFLLLNGLDLQCDVEERYEVFYRLASGRISEKQFAAWLRVNTGPSNTG